MNRHPWLSIWTEPRQTIRHIVETNPKRGFLLLSTLNGFLMALQYAQALSLGSALGLPAILIGSLIIAPLLGMLMFSISSLLFLWIGRWIGGKASYLEVRAAVSWTTIPNFVAIVLILLTLLVFPKEFFINSFPQSTIAGSHLIFVTVLFLTKMVLGIWSFILLIKALAEVQSFSVWKALLNILITLFLTVLAMSILNWVVGLIQGRQI